MKRTLQFLATGPHLRADPHKSAAKSSPASTASTSDSDFAEIVAPVHKARSRPASAESSSEVARKNSKKRRITDREESVARSPVASGSRRTSHRQTSSRPLPVDDPRNVNELESSDEEEITIGGMPKPALLSASRSGSERDSFIADASMSATTSASQPCTSVSATEGGPKGAASQPSSSRTSMSQDQEDRTRSGPRVVG